LQVPTLQTQEFVVAPPPIVSLPITGSNLRFPVRRIQCVGRNYLGHVREMGKAENQPPFFFSKSREMMVEDGGTVGYPPLTENFQHEVELVLAMKSGGMNIPVESALDHIYGYAIGFDMTRRDLQQAAAKNGKPWEIGKSFEQSACCSAIYPVSSVGHIRRGQIQLSVNGQLRQNSDVDQMIWGVPEIIHQLSTQLEIGPGDLIYTGTPEGVGPVVSGDELVGRIEGLGELRIKIG